MTQSIEIKLVVKIVLPFLPSLRELVDGLDQTRTVLAGDLTLNDRATVWQQGQSTQATLADARALLALFHPGFENSGKIVASSDDAHSVLRACAWLRLKLRAGTLSAISDDALNQENAYLTATAEPERLAVYSYLFLATLQEILLHHFVPLFPCPPSYPSWLGGLSNRLTDIWKRLRANPPPTPTHVTESSDSKSTPTPPQDSCCVVVMNDPVNLMSYVSALFQGLFDWPKDRADQHMREVHERGRSIVWRGSQAGATAYAATLQEWQLAAVVERDMTAESLCKQEHRET